MESSKIFLASAKMTKTRKSKNITKICKKKTRARTCTRTAAYDALHFVLVFSAIRVGLIEYLIYGRDFFPLFD